MTVSLGIGDVPSCRPSTTRLGMTCPDLTSDPDLGSGSEGSLGEVRVPNIDQKLTYFVSKSGQSGFWGCRLIVDKN